MTRAGFGWVVESALLVVLWPALKDEEVPKERSCLELIMALKVLQRK